MADITKEMFSEYEIKINGKSDVEQTLLRIFLFCGFDLTVNEIQEFMDIKPHYVYSNIKSKVTKQGMEIMTTSNDGFYISEQDLKLRGAGEMFGTKQSGEEGFVLSDVYNDISILRAAREEAAKVLEKEDQESKRLVYEISQGLNKSSKYICFN